MKEISYIYITSKDGSLNKYEIKLENKKIEIKKEILIKKNKNPILGCSISPNSLYLSLLISKTKFDQDFKKNIEFSFIYLFKIVNNDLFFNILQNSNFDINNSHDIIKYLSDDINIFNLFIQKFSHDDSYSKLIISLKKIYGLDFKLYKNQLIFNKFISISNFNNNIHFNDWALLFLYSNLEISNLEHFKKLLLFYKNQNDSNFNAINQIINNFEHKSSNNIVFTKRLKCIYCNDLFNIQLDLNNNKCSNNHLLGFFYFLFLKKSILIILILFLILILIFVKFVILVSLQMFVLYAHYNC
jgi:hypothetical protein